VIFGVEHRIVTEEMAACIEGFIAPISAGSNEENPEFAARACLRALAVLCERVLISP